MVLADVLPAWGRGAELVLAVILASAGVAKLADIPMTSVAIGRLLPRNRKVPGSVGRGLAFALSGAEVVVGALLLLRPSVATSAVTTALTVGFVAAVGVARRRGGACGCFGSLSVGVAGPVETRRALALASLAGSTLFVRLRNDPMPDGWSAGVGVAAIGAALFLVLVTAARAEAPKDGPRRRPLAAAAHIGRLVLAGRAPDRGGWRRVTPRLRARVVREVRADPVTADVIRRAGFEALAWRRATVRIRRHGATRVAMVVVRDPEGRLQGLWRDGVPSAVIGHTRTGIVVPRPADAPAAAPAASPPPSRP